MMALMAGMDERKKKMEQARTIYLSNKHLDNENIALVISQQMGLAPRKAKEYLRDIIAYEQLKQTTQVNVPEKPAEEPEQTPTQTPKEPAPIPVKKKETETSEEEWE